MPCHALTQECCALPCLDQKCYALPFSGDKIRSGCLTIAFSGAQKRAEVLHNPCILRGPQTKGDKIRIGGLTAAFWGAQKRAEVLRNPCVLGSPQTKGDKIRIGCLTPAFSGAQKRAEYSFAEFHQWGVGGDVGVGFLVLNNG